MSYNSTIPKATDIISQSQSDIQGNFAALAPFGNGYADFTVQSTNAPIVSTDTGLFTKSYTATGSAVANNEMFIQTQVNGGASQKIFPMTASTLSNTAVSVNLAGWSYLPSGLLIKWGNKDISSSNTNVYVDVDSISGGPAFTQIFNVQVTPYFGTTTNPLSAGVLSPINAWTGTSIGMWVNSTSGPASGKGVQYFVIGV